MAIAVENRFHAGTNVGNDNNPQILYLSFSDPKVLRACYMPMLKNKGIFVPSLQTRQLGEILFVVLALVKQDIRAAGLARVCWVTPEFCSDGCEAGFGLHFESDSDELRSVIESVLNQSGLAEQSDLSYTF